METNSGSSASSCLPRNLTWEKKINLTLSAFYNYNMVKKGFKWEGEAEGNKVFYRITKNFQCIGKHSHSP